MPFTLVDNPEVLQALLPFTHTRAISHIRCGIFTAAERWDILLEEPVAISTAAHLQPLYGSSMSDGVQIASNVVASEQLAAAVKRLQPGDVLTDQDGKWIARHTAPAPASAEPTIYPERVVRLQNPWDIFSHNAAAITSDVALLREHGAQGAIPEGVIAIRPENIYISKGALVQPGVVLNATEGPMYLGVGSEVMEGSLIRGPFALCEGAVVKMGAKVYGATSIGPGCKVGGEVNNVVFFANSNKGHDGFLGNAVIGEWCNLGADTNCSNLKNNYDEVKVWSETLNKSVATGLTFCGLLMGDHSKCGINTMFNTGTVVGVSANIFGSGFPQKFIPSFTWGGADGLTTYKLERALETAERMMARRKKNLNEAEQAVLKTVFERSAEQRRIFAP